MKVNLCSIHLSIYCIVLIKPNLQENSKFCQEGNKLVTLFISEGYYTYYTITKLESYHLQLKCPTGENKLLFYNFSICYFTIYKKYLYNGVERNENVLFIKSMSNHQTTPFLPVFQTFKKIYFKSLWDPITKGY